jgi:outer membrane protein assembly factor BamA
MSLIFPARDRVPSAVALAAVLVFATALPSAGVLAQDAAADDDPAPVLHEIVIDGNTKTDEAVILRVMDLRLGQPFTLETMDAAWDALEDSGHFQFVDLADDEGDDGRVTLYVNVEEDMSTYYGPVIRPDERHKYMLGAWLEERNLRGKAETLRLEADPLYLQRAEASWRRPWLAGVRGLEMKVLAEGESADFVYRPTRYRKWDAGLGVRWNFTGALFVRGGASYGHFLQRDDYTLGGELLAAGGENHWRFEGAVGLDSRDIASFPKRGLFLEAGARRWESNGFDSYTETWLDARVFVTVPWARHVLAVRGWARGADGRAQLDNRLFLGGGESLRGYQPGTIEGDEGWLASVEYRAPLFLMPISVDGDMIGFGLHAFADAGDAWDVDGRAGAPFQGWGAGAHVILDALQMRFEEAQDRDGNWRFHFTNLFNF